jgi:hypothetical protein
VGVQLLKSTRPTIRNFSRCHFCTVTRRQETSFSCVFRVSSRNAKSTPQLIWAYHPRSFNVWRERLDLPRCIHHPMVITNSSSRSQLGTTGPCAGGPSAHSRHMQQKRVKSLKSFIKHMPVLCFPCVMQQSCVWHGSRWKAAEQKPNLHVPIPCRRQRVVCRACVLVDGRQPV